MSVPSRVSSLLRNLLRARRVEQDLDDEVRSYADMLTDEKRAGGLGEEEARRAALVEIQGLEQVKEQVRETRAGTVLEQIWRDITYGVRVLLKHRGFTAAAVATLALGIGANTAIFSIVDTIVFRPLPYANPERLVKIWGTTSSTQRADVSWPDFDDIQRQSRSFERVAADDGMGFDVEYKGARKSVSGAMVTTEWLTTLGVRPLIGSAFRPEESRHGQDEVVILTHSYWRRGFASDSNVLGQVLLVDGRPHTIVGVLPPNVLRYGSDFLKPLVLSDYPTERGHRDLDVFARFRPDVTLAEAQAELDTIAARLERDYPETNKGRRLVAEPLGKSYASLDRAAIYGLELMLGAVGVVLLIACVNVVSLVMARGVTRARECVVRTALGASRGRLVRQMLVENVLLFLAGGALGILAARWSADSLIALAVASGYIPERIFVAIDGRVFAFGLIVSALAGLLFGLAPALEASRVDVNVGLRDSGPTVPGSRRRTRVRRVLIASELALSVVLLVGFGLLIRSFVRVQANATSLAVDTVLETSAEGGRSFETAVNFWRRAMESVRTIPGVTTAAVTSRPPVHGARQKRIAIAGRASLPADAEVGDILVSANYFRTLGITLVAGRFFTEADNGAAPAVAIVSETLARRYFSSESPIGRRLRVDEEDPMMCCTAASPVTGVWREIVGVVRDIRQSSLEEQPAATLYRPYSQIVEHDMYLMVRMGSANDAARIAKDVSARLALVAPGQEWANVLPLRQVIDGSETIRRRRFVLTLLGFFAAVAVALAAVGLYGLMAYFVAERRREIGIRIALGASQDAVLKHVLNEALRLAAVSLVLGGLSAQLLTKSIAVMLFGVSSTDVLTYASVWTLLAGVVLLASYFPARRAARVDPIVALREP